MTATVTKITAEPVFEKTFTFCTLVTRFDEYMEMVESAKKAGFDGSDVEFLYFDNRDSNLYDGYSGANRAMQEAKGRYLIYCHQDILFHDDKCKKLEECLNELNTKDPNWAIAGNAGKQTFGKFIARITDPAHDNLKRGNLPDRVQSLDENFLVINRQQQISSTAGILKGFHLYGLDLCQNAMSLGYSCYVIDFHLYHKSSGNVDASFYKAQQAYMDMQYNRKKNQYFATVCTAFFATSSKLANGLLKSRTLARWYRSYLKRK